MTKFELLHRALSVSVLTSALLALDSYLLGLYLPTYMWAGFGVSLDNLVHKRHHQRTRAQQVEMERNFARPAYREETP